MAQLPPINFQYPPVRYSPIQEAFRGALDAALAQAFLQPFEKKASERSLKEREAFSQFEIGEIPERARQTTLADINTGRVSEITDPNDLNLFKQAGIAPKYHNFGGDATHPGKDYFATEDIAHGHQPASPSSMAFVDQLRQRAGFHGAKDAQGKDVPIQYEWQAEQVAKEGGVLEQFASLKQQEHQFETL